MTTGRRRNKRRRENFVAYAGNPRPARLVQWCPTQAQGAQFPRVPGPDLPRASADKRRWLGAHLSVTDRRREPSHDPLRHARGLRQTNLARSSSAPELRRAGHAESNVRRLNWPQRRQGQASSAATNSAGPSRDA